MASNPPLPTLIRGARVFDGDNVSLATDVLVENGSIAEVGQNLNAPANAEVIGAQGMTLLPGLIDAHSHVWEAEHLRQAAVFGVTTALDMMGDPSRLNSLRKELEDGKLPNGADLRSAGNPFTAPGGHGTEYGISLATITDPAQADAFVRKRIAEGSDYIKFMLANGQPFELSTPSLSVTLLNAGVAAAHAHKRLALAHAGSANEALEAVRAQIDGLMHIWVGSSPAELIRGIAQQRIFVVPTLSIMMAASGQGQAQELVEDPRLSPYLSQEAAGHLYASSNYANVPDTSEFYRSITALHEQQIPLLVGTDSGNNGVDHGVTMHGEMRLLVEAGLSPLEALRGATSLPAARFALHDRGRIAKGLLGDLLLVRGDPTTEIRATRDIVAVWRAGRKIDREGYRATLATKVQKTLPPAAPTSIGDFETADPKLPFGRGWTISTDRFHNGRSTASLGVIDGGAANSRRALTVSGTVVESSVRYPWSGVLYSPGLTMMHPADLSSWKELVFWAKGDGKKYQVMFFLQSMGPLGQVQSFVATPEWTAYRFDFRTFGGTLGTDVKGIFFGAGVPGPYRFEIDGVELR